MPSVAQIPLGSGNFSVNAYLVELGEQGEGFVLVDTGMSRHRKALEEQLREAGCVPGALRLILITHGDFDHIGNAAYLRERFRAPIAMNDGDLGMSRDGDMFAGRNRPNILVRALLSLLARLPAQDRFDPDVALADGADLSGYGLGHAAVAVLPGHSAGSAIVRLEDGRTFCGDLLENRTGPALGSIMDDVPAARQSVGRLLDLEPTTIYPGHGEPFDASTLSRQQWAAPESA